MEKNKILEAIARYKFYHIIHLTDGITTPGCHEYLPAQDLCLKHLESLDLKGKRVLDIGCRDGLFSFKAESLGAGEVIGIDNDLSEPATQFLIPFFKSGIQMKQLNLYDLRPDTFGLFDIVVFPGVLYHLRYPFWGLKVIRDVMNIGGHLLIETPIWHGEPNKAMLFCPTGNEGPYALDPTSCTFFNEKGLLDTMKSLGFETVWIEYLTIPVEHKRAARSIKQLVRQKIEGTVKEILSRKGFAKSNLEATRCVFHLTYHGYAQGSFKTRYWEKTHQHHTRHGA
jgi:2-polyprenyl-3-methyl-5-hydroxy-6-metoxy-1,4-benzoquinol methylase